MVFALVDIDVNIDYDFLDLIPMSMEDYSSGKEKLLALKNRYIEIKKQQDLDRYAKWFKWIYEYMYMILNSPSAITHFP